MTANVTYITLAVFIGGKMSIGSSGRIVIEVPAEKKRKLYSELGKRGISLKDWFLDQVDNYLGEVMDPVKVLSPEIVVPLIEAGPVNMKSKQTTKLVTKPITNKLFRKYEALEKEFNVRVLQSDVSYVSPVNFVESLRRPRHRWFPYKEGFSPTFVEKFINEFSLNQTGTVFDPFAGVGTTGIVSGSMGFNAIGYDVSPMAVFIAKTKSINLEKKELREFSAYIKSIDNYSLKEKWPVPDNATVVSYFEEKYLEALLSVRVIANRAPTEKIRDLAMLAYLTLIEDFSTHRKAGNGVKRKTKFDYLDEGLTPIEQITSAFTNKLQQMEFDLAEDYLQTVPEFRQGSSIKSQNINSIKSISLALTSPPYANCFDYSKIYMRELWLGDFFKSKDDQKKFREDSIRSHVHATWQDRHIEHRSSIIEDLINPALHSQELWSKKIPDMLSGYFKDIGALLHALHPKFESGATFGIVVGNSVYGGMPVATDLLIAEIARNIGYDVKRIDVYRGMIPSSQQYNLINDHRWARESTVILGKE